MPPVGPRTSYWNERGRELVVGPSRATTGRWSVLRTATETIRGKRARVVAELPDWEELREAGRAIKADVLEAGPTCSARIFALQPRCDSNTGRPASVRPASHHRPKLRGNL